MQLVEGQADFVVGPGNCGLDEFASLGLEIQVPNTGALPIRGWAFGAIGHAVPETILLEVFSEKTGQTEVQQAQRMVREDVALHFGDPGLASSGFTARIQLGGYRCGRYIVHLVQRGKAGTYRLEGILRFSVLSLQYEEAARTDLAKKFLRGNGIEIGALQRRLAVPPDCAVRYVDRMSLSDLREHYPELNGFPLQEPDVIDDGERLSKFSDSSLDFVIANHFLEHCEDPIRTIQNLLRVLRPGGILYMAVPDKRSTFDYRRACTDWRMLVKTFSSGARPDRAELYGEWVECVMRQCGEMAGQTAQRLLEQHYSIHFNVWDLGALLDFLSRCRSELGLPFSPAAIASSENETILVLEGTSDQALG
jgi:SAM-dependent methyltransferase